LAEEGEEFVTLPFLQNKIDEDEEEDLERETDVPAVEFENMRDYFSLCDSPLPIIPPHVETLAERTFIEKRSEDANVKVSTQ